MKIIIGFLGIIGLVVLSIGIRSCISTSIILKETTEVKGVVIKNDCGVRPGSSCYPIVGFVDLNGQSHIFISNVGAKPARYDIDERITVAYQKGHPESAKIKSWLELWFMPTIAIGLGGLTIGPSLLIFLAVKFGFITVVDGEELESDQEEFRSNFRPFDLGNEGLHLI